MSQAGRRHAYGAAASVSSTSSASTSPVIASDSEPSLTKLMATASRPYHTHLNKNIISKLPDALPPNTDDPTIYAKGIRHMLPVYHTFESAWAKYTSAEPQTSDDDASLNEAVVLSILVHLHLPQLPRADRLRADLTDLLDMGLGEVESWVMDVVGEESLSNSILYDEKEKIRSTEGSIYEDLVDDEEDPGALGASSILRPREPEFPELRSFVRHIHYIARVKPHVLVAYAWVFYMALFNGGRWIRAQLSDARESWHLSTKTTTEDTNEARQNDEAGLSFWHFDGAHDGEDVKDEFKARMKDAEQLINKSQKQDIVEEAVYIFQVCGRLVTEIDDLVGKPASPVDGQHSEGEMQQSYMIGSELMQPRAEAPWRFLELLFRVMLPLGLFDFLAGIFAWLKRSTRHLWTPMLAWAWNDSPIVAKNK